MAHAGPATLDRLEPLLAAIRELGVAEEPKRGIFYRRRIAFLHFHEEAGRILADLKQGRAFERYPANSKRDWARLLAAVKRASVDRPARGWSFRPAGRGFSDAPGSSVRARRSLRPCR